MAAVTLAWFTNGLSNLVGGNTDAGNPVDWRTDTIKVALVNAVPNQDTPVTWADLIATEVTGTGWAARGVALTSKTVLVDTGTNTTGLDAADVSVPTVTVAGVEAIVVYKDTGTNNTSVLLGYGDLDATSGSSGGTLSIVWNAAGLLTITAS